MSIFPDEEGLYRYMLLRRGKLCRALLVELEGEPTDGEDFDADEGALLIRPMRIVDVREPDWRRIEELWAPRGIPRCAWGTSPAGI